MKKSNKLTAAVTASMVASTLVVPAAFASATEFTDISNSYAKDAIMELVEAGILNGTGEGKFNPAGKISRQDFAIILAKTLNLDTENVPAVPTFSDVPATHYSYKYVEAAVAAELIAGTGDGQFGLGQNLTREAMAVLFVRATGEDVTGYGDKLTFSDADKISAWAKDAVAYAVEMGLMNGAGNNAFNPQGLAERQQVALVASNFLKAVKPVEAGKMVSATLTDETTITIGFDKEIDTLTAEDVTVAVKATGAAVAVESVSLSEDMKSATVKVAKLAAGTTFEVSYKEATEEVTTEAVALKVSKVKAVTNSKVEVTLTDAVTSATASLFTVKDAAGTAVEVKGATLSADGKSVIVETAALTAYTAYSITAGDVTKTFVALPADTTKPTNTSVTVDTYKTVTIKFSERVDAATATNVANYKIDNNLTVEKAELSADGLTVTLTTAEQLVGTFYTVTVSNVADLAGNVADKFDGYFGGMAKDTTAQTVNTAGTLVTDFNQVKVTFGKDVDAATATNVANYSLDNGLQVLKAEVDANNAKVVYLTTADQVVGTLYSLKINNVTDKLGNKLANEVVYAFGGMAKDLSKPAVSATVTDNNKVTVTFTKKVDAAEATNVNNYKVDNNLTVTSAELATDGVTVTLTTAPQTVGTFYTMTIENVKSIYGTAIDKTTQYFGGMAKDVTGPAVNTVTATAGQVVIAFNEKVNADSATELTNYVFDGGLGYATSAVLSNDGLSVTLTTAAQKPGSIYNVTINNVLDLNGNAISATNNANKRSFVGKGNAQNAVVKFQGASVVNQNTVDLYFDSELAAADITALAVGLTKADANNTVVTTTGTHAEVLENNKKVVRVQFNSADPALFAQGTVYKATVTGVTNLVVADSANVKSFAGTNVVNEAPTLKAVVPVDANTVKVMFSEEVAGLEIADFTVVVPDTDNAAATVTGLTKVSATEYLLYLSRDTKHGQVYGLQVTGAYSDKSTFVAGVTTDTNNAIITKSFGGTNVANEAPTVKYVVSADVNNIDVVFSEAVQTSAELATYTITDADGNTLNVSGAVLSADGKSLRLQLDNADLNDVANTIGKVAAGKVYNVAVTGLVEDLSGKDLNIDVATTNKANKAQFAGTNVVNAAPAIAGVEYNGATSLKVIFSEKIKNQNLNFLVNGANTAILSAVLELDGKTVTITLNGALAEGIATVAATNTVVDVNNVAAKTDAVQFGVQGN